MEAAGDKTFYEFFAGAGLVRHALDRTGWRCLYANDNEKAKWAFYRGRFGDAGEFHLENVWNLLSQVGRLPGRPFLATGSFPCTDLSAAGKGEGLDGERSSTFYGMVAVLRALRERRPAVVLLENVLGLVTSRGGKCFQDVVAALEDLDYRVGASVVDARHFVPQSRPRVFVLGVRGPLAEGAWMAAPSASARRPGPLSRAMAAFRPRRGWLPTRFQACAPRYGPLANVIDVGDGAAWWGAERTARGLAQMRPEALEWARRAGASRVGMGYHRTRNGKVVLETRFDGVAGCLRASQGGGSRQVVVHAHDGHVRMRWVDGRDSAALQGAPHYPLGPIESRNRWAMGDAVCVPVIEWLDEHVLSPLFKLSREA